MQERVSPKRAPTRCDLNCIETIAPAGTHLTIGSCASRTLLDGLMLGAPNLPCNQPREGGVRYLAGQIRVIESICADPAAATGAQSKMDPDEIIAIEKYPGVRFVRPRLGRGVRTR